MLQQSWQLSVDNGTVKGYLKRKTCLAMQSLKQSITFDYLVTK